MNKTIAATRRQQDQKIINLVRDFINYDDDLQQKTCVDIGCGNGEISFNLAGVFKSVIGIELETRRILVNHNLTYQNNHLQFMVADGSILPFSSGSVDFVVCAQVYEHAKDQKGLINEIWRVLKPNGYCFLSGPNKFAILEEHYFLPFLSWLPSKLANSYLKLFKLTPIYDIHPLSYSKLLGLMDNFIIDDLTFKLITKPDRYGMSDRFGILNILKHFPIRLLVPFRGIVPNFNFILRKSVNTGKE